MSSVTELDSSGALPQDGGLCLLHLYAPWSPQCSQMSKVAEELAKDITYGKVKFLKLEAEKAPEFCIDNKVVAVPTFLFIRSGAVVDRVDGAHAADLTEKLGKYAAIVEPSKVSAEPTITQETLNKRLGSLLNMAPVMLFMKGTPDEPRCGFSRKIVELLRSNGVGFNSFDILTDPEVRQGLKELSKWPTYPQLYARGELVGGLDVVQELAEEGELLQQLPSQRSMKERLQELVKRANVMLFMKGTPEQPRCGFSKTMIEILNATEIEYDTFDILEDKEVRQSLKEFSNWPTYPQLYVKGELIGGLDIVKELKEDGSLKESLMT